METTSELKEELKEFDCVDCDENTSRWFLSEYYMVDFDLWNSVMGGQNTGMLCIGCLEVRIGRKLASADFIEAPINYGIFGASDRLKDRLGAKFINSDQWFEAKVKEND